MAIIDGTKIAQKREKKLAVQVAGFQKKTGLVPMLQVIWAGDDRSSGLYVKKKQAAARRVGIKFNLKKFPADTDPEKIEIFIRKVNQDSQVHGLMVQLPLPDGLIAQTKPLVNLIDPRKDVDCLTERNFNLLKRGKPRFLPATVKAVMVVLEEAGLFPAKVIVVGASGMVGKPLVAHLKSLGADVIAADEYTEDLKSKTIQADVLISATGVPALIKESMVKEGVKVIDVGSPKGDVDFDRVSQKASLITPVPGGVGPLTVACFLENTLRATILGLPDNFNSFLKVLD